MSKAIDKAAGAEREVVGSKLGQPGYSLADGPSDGVAMSGNVDGSLRKPEAECAVTAPATPEAERWEGWGTALKPAHEPIVVARKPLAGNVATNVLVHGTGALNIDGCRIGFAGGVDERESKGKNRHADFDSAPRNDGTSGIYGADLRGGVERGNYDPPGRWPANVVLSHSEGCVLVGERRVSSDGHFPAARGASGFSGGWDGQDGLEERHLAGEVVQAWECVPGCAVRALDEQSGEMRARGNVNPTTAGGGLYGLPVIDADHGAGDRGGASRFFFTAQRHRIEGCEIANTAEPSSSRAAAPLGSAPSDAAISGNLGETRSSTSKAPSTAGTQRASKAPLPSDTGTIPSTDEERSRSQQQGERIPSPVPANPAELPAPIDTTMITASQPRSDGCAGRVTSASTEMSSAAGDQGCARFRYAAKASRRERDAGLREGLPRARSPRKRYQQDAADRWWPRATNRHPTVKPIDLMRWLVRLVTPPGGVVLDPFAGSGSTGCAAVLEGFRFVGIDRDASYVRVARARVRFWSEHPTGLPVEAAFVAEGRRRRARDDGQLGLDFG